jgi:hypothetical protein
MSKWPLRGHFRYLRFQTFPMTPRTPQCEVFWALLWNSKHSGVPEDSKSPTLEVLSFTPTLGQSGVATTPMLLVLKNCIFVGGITSIVILVNKMANQRIVWNKITFGFVAMFSNVNGPFNVEIKPTTNLDSLVKFPDSNWTSSSSKPSYICTFKPNVLI